MLLNIHNSNRQMVPEFEQPAFYGELNELLGPIKTKFVAPHAVAVLMPSPTLLSPSNPYHFLRSLWLSLTGLAGTF